MEKKIIITQEQLDNMPVDAIKLMYLQLQESFNALNHQLETITKQNASLQEQLAVLTQQMYGRKTEKTVTFDSRQLVYDLENMLILNEAEYLVETCIPSEPDMTTVVRTVRKKSKGKREADLKFVETQVDVHALAKEHLDAIFPKGYDKLPDEIYYDLEYVPAKFIKHEHHVEVYAGKGGEGIIRADRPERLLSNSILTPALAAAVFNAKYVNAIPLNRLSEEFKRHDVIISRQTMAGWMIRLTERYLGSVYRAMIKKLLSAKLIHCDETPFKLIGASKSPNSKSYMWVYHTYDQYGAPPIFIYEYQPSRKAEFPREFFKDFKGTLVTDGYHAYHKIAAERPEELVVAGCWAHVKRKFTDIAKAVGSSSANGTIAADANLRIAAIYHIDNMKKDASKKERAEHRKNSVKPLVDAYFAWLKTFDIQTMDKSGKLYKAIQYSLNQESYLREFLNDPMIPMDNNDAERSIRKFCIGKHNWNIIASTEGAVCSGMLYSIAETAKANELKPYEYFKYLLEQILDHLDDPPAEYLEDIMPWSDKLPEYCRKLQP